MIDKEEFKLMITELEADDKLRDSLMTDSREIIKISKQIIYAVQRDDLDAAESNLGIIKEKVESLGQNKRLTGMQNVAIQEYVEAISFYTFIKTGNLITKKECNVSTENYLLGLCDLTGELGRKTVNSVIKENYDLTHKIHKIVTEIYGEFLNFNLRNSELRKKSDSIKWNLGKIEDVVYNLQMRK